MSWGSWGIRIGVLAGLLGICGGAGRAKDVAVTEVGVTVEAVPDQGTPDETDEQAVVAVSGPLYWDLRLHVTLGEADRTKRVRVFLPLSDERQTILRRSFFAEPLQYRELLDGANLLGQWSRALPSRDKDQIFLDVTARIDGAREPVPLDAAIATELTEWLAVEPRLQVNDPQLRATAQTVAGRHGATLEGTRALFDFVANAIERVSYTAVPLDAARVLADRRGDAAGKARLLTTLLRARGIPARMVGGLVLKDLKRRKRYTYWVEVPVRPAADAQARGVVEWIPLDPTRGYFGRLPNRFLALFRGDLVLMRHTAAIDFDYEFLVTQTSAEEATQAFRESLAEPDDRSITRLASNEKEMTAPVASIVWIADREIPPSLTEKLTALAGSEQVKVSFLIAPYESRLFRGEFIEDVIKSHDRLVREADVLVIQTRDDACLSAIMSQAGRRGVFRQKTIYLNGAMYPSVAEFFGSALVELFHPKALYIVPTAAETHLFWDFVADHFLNGFPIDEVAAKGRWPLHTFTAATPVAFSAWRRFLRDTWVRAARAGITPHGMATVLVLPLIALLVVCYRGILGFETFGTFAPVIMCVAFLRTGLVWGTFLFLAILGLGILLRLLLTRVHLFLVARMALLIGLVALVMLAVAMVGIWWGLGPLVDISVFPMVIMAGMIEHFTRTHMEVGWREAVTLSGSTLAICILGYLLTEWLELQSLVIVYPELLVATIAASGVIGLWKGLRVVELWRYYRVGRAA
ncbi:MAG: hypothetical protein HY696_03120 [Deltaproteobacteria bacterium]|nr:hypothetical protein [Deltaproteobacteria bacterium]